MDDENGRPNALLRKACSVLVSWSASQVQLGGGRQFQLRLQACREVFAVIVAMTAMAAAAAALTFTPFFCRCCLLAAFGAVSAGVARFVRYPRSRQNLWRFFSRRRLLSAILLQKLCERTARSSPCCMRCSGLTGLLPLSRPWRCSESMPGEIRRSLILKIWGCSMSQLLSSLPVTRTRVTCPCFQFSAEDLRKDSDRRGAWDRA